MHSKPYPLTQGLVRAIVAMCENSEDRLRLLALAVLSELSVYDMALLTRSEGLRVILQSFVEGPPELSPYLALVFLPIMDMPDARRMLRPGLDIEVATLSLFQYVVADCISQLARSQCLLYRWLENI